MDRIIMTSYGLTVVLSSEFKENKSPPISQKITKQTVLQSFLRNGLQTPKMFDKLNEKNVKFNAANHVTERKSRLKDGSVASILASEQTSETVKLRPLTGSCI